MEKIGALEMHFSHIDDGVYYYQLDISVAGVKRTILLPRYHRMMGWIEAFGLPPQFEWVILEGVPDFSKTARLVIDNEAFEEVVSYTHERAAAMHRTSVTRTGILSESATCTEDYTAAPQAIRVRSDFEHPAGIYTCETAKAAVTEAELSSTEAAFIQKTKVAHGPTETIWKKTFTAAGSLPPVYYRFFPPIPGLDLTECAGTILEVGYLATGGSVDQAHGSWHKLVDVNGKQFYILESDYSSREIDGSAGKEVIKDTYRKELFSL